MQIKKLPPNTSDRRYARPIDGLRAMTWHSFVKESTNNSSNYQLDQLFGGGRARWAAYEKGSQPNEQLLNFVNRKVEGSKDVYLCGPDNEKLWPAICTHEINELKLIEELGRSADKLIAEFRIRVIENKIPLEYDGEKHFYPPKNEHLMHPFDEEMLYIDYVFQGLLGSQLSPVATSILRAEIKPYQDKVEADARKDWYDFIVFNPYTTADVQKMMREESYSLIQMRTVKNKGVKIANDRHPNQLAT